MPVEIFFFLSLLFIFTLPILSGVTLLFFTFNYSSKRSAFFLLCIACILLNIGFLLVTPANGVDLERYFNVLSEMRTLSGLKSLVSFWQVNLQYERTNLLFTLVEWLVSRTHYSTLLPFITTTLCSFFVLYPFLDLSQKYENKIKIILLFVFAFIAFFLVGYGWMASTSRWGLAVTSAFFVDYIYFVKLKEKKFFLLLLLPILFHIGSIAEIIFALYAIFVKKRSFFKLILVSVPTWLYLQYTSSQSYSSQLSSSYSVSSQLNFMTNVYSAGLSTFNFHGSVTMVIMYCTVLVLSLIVLRDIHINRKLGIESCPTAIILLFQTNCLLVLMLIGKSDILNRFIIFPAMFGLIYEGLNIRIINLKRWVLFLLIFFGAITYEVIMVKQFQFVLSPVQVLVSNFYTILRNVQVY